MNRDHRFHGGAARLPPGPGMKLRLKLMLGLLAAASLPCVIPRADAESASATFQATASVVKACTLSTPGTSGYEIDDPNPGTPPTASFNVTCTPGTPYSIGFDAGPGAGATAYAATGARQGITVYGQMPADSYTPVPAADEAGTLTMTLSY